LFQRTTKADDLFSSLEFDWILNHLSSLATSPLGAELALQLVPSDDIRWVEERLSQVSELRAILDFDDPFPIHGIKDIRKSLDRASIKGNILSPQELVDIAETLTTARRLKKYFQEKKGKYPQLERLVLKLETFPEVEKVIANVVDFSSLEVKDEATPELARIRRDLSRTQEKLKEKLNSILLRFKNYLQEPIITIREGRMVIPVKEEHRKRVRGFVHDQSASGATLFIEPLETLELNNRIRELEIHQRKEIERILQEITALIGRRIEGIRKDVEILAQIDLIYAKALLSQKLNASEPKLNQENRIEVVNGRHPILLLREDFTQEVVPLNLEVGERFRTLVITGPNAGGKTVALKTVGVLTLMTQCGLHIPADESSQMAIFQNIFADIGDQQSIEKDLSTFSARMEKLRDILEGVNQRSLVLIDEVGAGTDPAEGAALAMSLLEELTQRGCVTIATTHQGALKAFVMGLEGAENGAMEFDQQTLQPTYKFRLGFPGSSYAFEIAQRLGVPKRIIQRSRELTGEKKSRLEDLILELERKARRYDSLLREVEIKRSELEGLVKLYRRKYQELERNEKELRRKALEESKEILARANAAVEAAIREIRTKAASRESIKFAKELLEKQTREIEGELETFIEKKKDSQKIELEVGDRVLWRDFNTVGRVISRPDSSGRVMVEMGNLELRLDASELKKVSSQEGEPTLKRPVRYKIERQISDELNIRGMRADEIEAQIDRFLDKAYLLGLQQVRIIHGKGRGTLRKRVWEYLENHPKVKNKRLGAWGEGDVGVTIVELK